MKNKAESLILSLCYEIDTLKWELGIVTKERDELRQKLNKTNMESIRSSERLMGGLLTLALKKDLTHNV